MSTLYNKLVEKVLDTADIKINGNRPWDMQIHNPDTIPRIMRFGNLGAGESYMDGWWDCQQLDDLICRFIKATKKMGLAAMISSDNLLDILKLIFFNLQSRFHPSGIGESHYHPGNDLFEKMLDKRMIYSCARWKDKSNLDQAQEAKLELILKPLGLKKGMRLLDIGCGFGGLLKYAYEKYGVSGLGVTITKEEAELGKKLCEGLPIEIRLQDFKDLHEEKFDAITADGVLSHLGIKNCRLFMEICHRLLNKDGVLAVGTSGSPVSGKSDDSWTSKYIYRQEFPSLRQIAAAAENKFMITELYDFGPDLDRTLVVWCDNFKRAWPELKEKYPERFKRMWEYFLLVSAGAFRARELQYWNIVLSLPSQ